jgi:hypothetical protein
MKAKNRYYSRSRITEAKFRQIIRFFAMDLTASDTAKLTNISVRSINTIYIRLRKKIAANVRKYLLSTVSLNLMNPTLVLVVFEENVDVVHQEKPLYLDYSKEMETYTQKLCLIAPKLRYRALFGGI